MQMLSKLKKIWYATETFEKKIIKYGLFSIISISLVAIFILPIILTIDGCNNMSFMDTGQVGDTIGGISAPFIGTMSAILTFLAFYIQYQANQQQKKQLLRELRKQKSESAVQDRIWKVERFENKFYELLRFHKENVSEIAIGRGDKKVFRRRAFLMMFRELKYTFYYCKQLYKKQRAKGELNEEYDDRQLLKLAYIYFYSGVGNSSNIVSKSMAANKNMPFDSKFYEYVTTMMYHSTTPGLQEVLPLFELKDDEGHGVSPFLPYRFWDGHQSRLAHYYRHLFQTVKFVANQDESIITLEMKKDYLRTLRAQLSDYEQLMLYYNAIANFGSAWIDNGYLTKFRMIHNIPIPLANFGVKPEELFNRELSEDPTLFEWLE